MFLRFGWVGGSFGSDKGIEQLSPPELCSIGRVPPAVVSVGGHLVSVLVPLLSPGTVRYQILDLDGGGTQQADNGCLDPLYHGLRLLLVDLGVLGGVDADVRGQGLTGVLGEGPISEHFLLFRGE